MKEITHYADGKIHTKIEKIQEFEKIYGINRLSPFGTNSREVFLHILKGMELENMNRMASKVGAPMIADKREQTAYLLEAFNAYSKENPPVHNKMEPTKIKIDHRKRSSKEMLKDLDYARNKSVFEKDFPEHSPEEFRNILKSYTLADLQNLAAKVGFNPIFERVRIVDLLAKEFEKDYRTRVK